MNYESWLKANSYDTIISNAQGSSPREIAIRNELWNEYKTCELAALPRRRGPVNPNYEDAQRF